MVQRNLILLFSSLILISFLSFKSFPDQATRAYNYTRSQYAVTANSYTVTSSIEGSWWIYSDATIYIDTEGTTPNSSDESLSGGTSRNYFPLIWDSGKTVKLYSVSGTSNVVIYVMDF